MTGAAVALPDLPSGWAVESLTGSIGAIVHGVDLTGTLVDDDIAAIRSALVGHRVIFFRDQHITPRQLIDFAGRFGPLTPAHPLVGGLDDEHPEVLVLDSADYPLGVGSRNSGTSYNDRWHTDVTFSERPPTGTVLAAKTIPARGGDTLWADLIGAYESLSDPIRHLLDGLVAVHDASSTFSRFRDDDPDGTQRERLANLRSVRHPVVRVHPETGERGLFVNDTFTSEIEGLLPTESDALLQMLYRHSVQPEHVVRWRWREGDVAFWDNRSTAHYATADYGDSRRVMHRVTIAGDRPIGVNGAID
jgi:alpha-ketoglutarate-dependent sulfate ester dioxygenase